MGQLKREEYFAPQARLLVFEARDLITLTLDLDKDDLEQNVNPGNGGALVTQPSGTTPSTTLPSGTGSTDDDEDQGEWVPLG